MDKVQKPCFNFNNGSCHFGQYCKFLHNEVHGNATVSLPRGHDIASSSALTSTDIATLQSLLAKLNTHGINNNIASVNNQPLPNFTGSHNHVACHTQHSYGPPGFISPSQAQSYSMAQQHLAG